MIREMTNVRLMVIAASFLFMTVFWMPAPALSNSLIGNTAIGSVKGSIIIGTGSGASQGRGDSAIHVGTITAGDKPVMNVSVHAHVDGNIVVPAGTTISIGSYRGK